ncbi:FadR/GntR family transcriptional regulator [Roseomonas chloroacetimidivorans]|uniref:FadR/GntR family transcriptional regulator n=1 Tax=Roseomonas chloroacetimidivorans TaxID=1766656 RepID=UPI003C74986B
MNRRSVVDDVRAQLVSLIESGHFRVDEKLPSENSLAKSFNVSRPMVREALVGLNALGLTASRTGRGTFVVSRQVNTTQLTRRFPSNDLTEVRLLVEVPAASMAAVRRSPEQVRQLGQLQQALRTEEDEKRRHEIDDLFHLGIAEATGNPILVRLVGELRATLREQATTKIVLPERRLAEVAEHQAIFDALARGDAHAAGHAMEMHLRAFDGARDRLDGP